MATMATSSSSISPIPINDGASSSSSHHPTTAHENHYVSSSKHTTQPPPYPHTLQPSSLAAAFGPLGKTRSREYQGELLEKTYSMSSKKTRSSNSTRAENMAPNRVARSLPPWIDSYEKPDPLSPPNPAQTANHHFGTTPSPPTTANAPPSTSGGQTHQTLSRVSEDGWIDDDAEASMFPNKKNSRRVYLFRNRSRMERGRKWDHARSRAPIILQVKDNERSAWIPFVKSSMYGPAPDEDGQRVDPEVLKDMNPGYEKPWRGDLMDAENGYRRGGRRQVWYKQLQHLLLTHPLVPLLFRITTLLTSITALSLACSIFVLSASDPSIQQSSSTIMAIAVDVIAMPYILYITYDEYTGRPIGLRSAKNKLVLVLLDLFFIIFESANSSLAFDNLRRSDSTGCGKRNEDEGSDMAVCGRQAALGGVLLIALLGWSLTFSVSIFRVVERIGGGGRDDDDGAWTTGYRAK